MNGRRVLRLVWVGVCNATWCYFVIKLFAVEHDIGSRLLAGAVLALSCIGLLLEFTKRKSARLINTLLPASIFVALASSIIWLPATASVKDKGEAGEGAGFLFILSLVPLLIAAITWIAYKVIDISPEDEVATLHLR